MSEPGGFQVHQDTEAGVLADPNVPMRVVTVTQDSLRLVTRLEDGTPVYWESGERTAPGEVVTQPLTGFAAGSNTAIVPTDSVIGALQKAQGQLNAKLNVADPEYEGTLTGPSATLTDFGKLTALVGDSSYAAVYGTGVTPSGSNYSLRFDDSGSSAVLNASTALALGIGGASKLGVTASEVDLASGVALKMSATTVIDSSRNITGTTLKGSNLTGTGNRPLVAGADGTIDDQDAAMFRGTIGAGTSNLALGETSATAYRGDRGKTAYDHSQATGNPHGTTAADVGAAPSTHMHLSTDVRTGADAQVGGILVSSSADPDQPFIYGIAPRYGQTDGGPWRFLGAAWQEMPALSDSDVRLGDWTTGKITNDHVADGAAIAWDKISKTGAAAADIGAAKAPSKLEVSASTTLGSIDATAIKVTATDVNLTLSGGVDGQGWDIVCPTTSLGISIPTGVTLYAYNGSDIGPTTHAVGGGRGIRIVRIDAATWIAPNLTW